MGRRQVDRIGPLLVIADRLGVVVDAYVTDTDHIRHRVRTDADGTLWDVAHADLVYVTPRP